jgi:predicted dehydrogenase
LINFEEVLVVGLGAAGQTHLSVLAEVPGVTQVTGVDTDPSRALSFREHKVPVYPSVLDASREQTPQLVVVATPTPTHAEVCDQVFECFPRSTVLLEKPAADNITDARRLLSGGHELIVSLHMAFAPEVSWAKSVVEEEGHELGDLISMESWAADPHQFDLASATASLSNSWVDNGINALSVMDRFARVTERNSLRPLKEDPSSTTFEGVFSCETESGLAEAIVITSWSVGGSTRSTRIRFSSGVEIIMDHDAVAGYLIRDGRVASFRGKCGPVPRRTTHYEALYRAMLTDSDTFPSPETNLRLHDLLLAPPLDFARWTSNEADDQGSWRVLSADRGARDGNSEGP